MQDEGLVFSIAERNRFYVEEKFLDQFRGRQPRWGYGALSYVLYKRSYARELPGGGSEEFWQTLQRVTEGTFSILRQRIRETGQRWSDSEAQAKAQEFYRRMWDFKFLPSGRMLWSMGTRALEVKGGSILSNCAFRSTTTIDQDFAAPFCSIMDLLMLGLGVGFDTRGAGKLGICKPIFVDVRHVVEDSREGWIDALRRVLKAFVGGDCIPKFDYSQVRGPGVPLVTFGGTANGPKPLEDLLTSVTGLLTKRIGQLISHGDIVDIANFIGRCVVAGNIRRSSELAIGPAECDEFTGLKDPSGLNALIGQQYQAAQANFHWQTLEAERVAYVQQQRGESPLTAHFAAIQDRIDNVGAMQRATLADDPAWRALEDQINAHPLRTHRWASNNTVMCEPGHDYSGIADKIASNGEPGVMWLENIRRFGRMADPPNDKDSKALGTNPCQPAWATVLTPEGIRTFKDISVGSIIWSGFRWTHVTHKVCTGVKKVFAFRTLHGTFYGTPDHVVLCRGHRVKVGEASHIDHLDLILKPEAPDSVLAENPYRALEQVSATVRVGRLDASAIVARNFVSEEPVFDIRVDDDDHTYVTDGMLVSNCSEISLWNSELCCVPETFPTKHDSFEDYKQTLRMAYLLGKTVMLVPTHDPAINAVISRNRRLGISMAGVASLYEKLGMSRMRNWLDQSYRHLKALDADYSGWMGVPESIKITSVKPGGSCPLLTGHEGGMKFPTARTYMRTMRIGEDSPLIEKLKRAGYRVEPDRYTPCTMVAYFPIYAENADRVASEVPLWEQAAIQRALQAWWSDNQVSATLTFRPEEARDIKHVLEAHETDLKTASFLPLNDHGYVQAPYTVCSSDEYATAMSRIKTVDLDRVGHEVDEKYCDGEKCVVGP